MAHVEDRWFKSSKGADGKVVRQKTNLHGKGMRYRVRYIAPDGREKSKSFPDRDKRSAEAFLVTIEADKVRQTYIDPDAGRITFGAYARTWLAAQTFNISTREVTERRLNNHILPHLGHLPLRGIDPSHIRALDRQLQLAGRAASFRAVVFGNISTIFNAAVDDKRIAANPCHARSARRPSAAAKAIVPWTANHIRDLRNGLPERYKFAVDAGAGCGLRQGEIFGIAREDFDLERNMVHVIRQVKIVNHRNVFGLPKGEKTRDVPLPASVARALKRHCDVLPTVPVTLPWGHPGGPLTTVNLVLYGPTGIALNRNHFNPDLWHPALEGAGIERTRESGMHALRHFYASSLLDAGESIKALSQYLGHSNPAFTLRTYTHLMPSSEDRTRNAIDRILEDQDDDGLTTA